jgi:hypothetical protein
MRRLKPKTKRPMITMMMMHQVAEKMSLYHLRKR